MMKLTLPLSLALALLAGCATAPQQVAACQGACRSHEDGYQWAQRANMTDASSCVGNYSPEFLDGCRDGVDDLYQLRRSNRSL